MLATAAGLSYWAYDTYCVWPMDQNLTQCQGYWGVDGGDPNSYTWIGDKPIDPAYVLKRHLASVHRNVMNFTLLLLGASPVYPTMRERYLPYFKEPNYH